MSCPKSSRRSRDHIRVEKARILIPGHEGNISVRNNGREQTKIKPDYDHTLIVSWRRLFYNKKISLQWVKDAHGGFANSPHHFSRSGFCRRAVWRGHAPVAA